MANSNLYDTDFVKKFTIAIIKTVQKSTLNIKNSEIINADMIPEMSKDLMQAITTTQEGINSLVDMHQELGEDETANTLQQQSVQTLQKINTSIQKEQVQSQHRPLTSMSRLPRQFISSRGGMSKYGKLQSFLMDPTIMIVQCSGPNQPIAIVKRGRRQTTTITLTQEEINDSLTKFATDAHIPFIEGPFHATVNGMTISGVSSSLVGSSFTINRIQNR